MIGSEKSNQNQGGRTRSGLKSRLIAKDYGYEEKENTRYLGQYEEGFDDEPKGPDFILSNGDQRSCIFSNPSATPR